MRKFMAKMTEHKIGTREFLDSVVPLPLGPFSKQRQNMLKNVKSILEAAEGVSQILEDIGNLHQLDAIFDSFIKRATTKKPCPSFLQIAAGDANGKIVVFKYNDFNWKGEWKINLDMALDVFKNKEGNEFKIIIPLDGCLLLPPQLHGFRILGKEDRHNRFYMYPTWYIVDKDTMAAKLPAIYKFISDFFDGRKPDMYLFYSEEIQGIDIECVYDDVMLTIQFEIGVPQHSYENKQ